MIKDGKGRGFAAEVDSNQRLRTLTDARSLIGRASTEGNTYSIYAVHNIVAANTPEQLLFLKVNSDIDIILSHIVFSGKGTQVKFEMFFDTTYTSGGTALTSYNLNRKSSKSLDVTVYDNSSNDLIVAGNTKEFLDVRIANQSFISNFKDALLLGRNNSFSIQAEGTTIGDQVRATLFYYKRG